MRWTVTGGPAYRCTRAERSKRATHPPRLVPANAPPAIVAWVTRPLGANVTLTRTAVGPESPRQLPAAPAAARRMEASASLALKRGRDAASAGGSTAGIDVGGEGGAVGRSGEAAIGVRTLACTLTGAGVNEGESIAIGNDSASTRGGGSVMSISIRSGKSRASRASGPP